MRKCGPHPVGEFEGWPELKGKERDLVYFAVKKEHDMNYRYNYNRYNNGKCQEVLTYEKLVYQAINSVENEFEYHNHFYTVQENEEDGYDVISDGEKVAEVLIEEEERIVVIEEEKKEYVRNTRSAYYESMYKKELEKIRVKSYPEIPKSEDER